MDANLHERWFILHVAAVGRKPHISILDIFQFFTIISLDNMDNYFDNTTKFAYGEFMVNELLGTELSC